MRKSLAQHHLRDGRSARPLIEFLAPAGRTVLEIGAGGGALTAELLAAGAARVVAVELDLGWALVLHARRVGAGPGTAPPDIVVADALELEWARLPARWLVTGNLPYNVATALLERVLAAAPAGTRCGFLLQKEVVDRLVAAPGTKQYGALSVLVAARAAVRRLGTLRPGAFVPPPRVESSFVGLELRAAPLPPAGMPAFERVVRAAFAQRRKTLLNALGASYGKERARAALATAGIGAGVRAERLGLAEFVALARACEASARGDS